MNTGNTRELPSTEATSAPKRQFINKISSDTVGWNIRPNRSLAMTVIGILRTLSQIYVANVARVNAATLASLASAPAPPSDVKMLTQQLENDTTLAWTASPDNRAASYEIVWRATTAPDWESKQDVGNVTKATIKISKDNVVFGVRAVDNQGHRGLIVVPLPSRSRD